MKSRQQQRKLARRAQKGDTAAMVHQAQLLTEAYAENRRLQVEIDALNCLLVVAVEGNFDYVDPDTAEVTKLPLVWK